MVSYRIRIVQLNRESQYCLRLKQQIIYTYLSRLILHFYRRIECVSWNVNFMVPSFKNLWRLITIFECTDYYIVKGVWGYEGIKMYLLWENKCNLPMIYISFLIQGYIIAFYRFYLSLFIKHANYCSFIWLSKILIT